MKFRVLSDINAGQYKAGDIVDLLESEAALMPWALEPLQSADAPEPEPPQKEKPAKLKSRRRKKE